MTWTWNRRRTIVKDKEFVDHVHERWSLEEGHSAEAAKNGRPWCLCHRGIEIEFCKTLADGKRLAEEMEKIQGGSE